MIKIIRSILMILPLISCVQENAMVTNSNQAMAPVVKTTLGEVRGVSDDGVDSFKGIPYAAPPVGEYRWRPPQPAEPWQGVLDASRFGAACAQTGWGPGAGELVAGSSEDCLYLNLWLPAKTAANAKLPVMVWIHGGGFTAGAGSNPESDGTRFAKEGVILVTFNYRLGRLGFFAFPAINREYPDEFKGNYAYMDQIAALKWVQRNIAAFGGDPDNITIFGESAGGVSVHSLLTIPNAHGLFHKAIIESGGGRNGTLTGRPINKNNSDPFYPVSAETAGTNFARSRGIDGTDERALEKLRALSIEKIIDGGRTSDAEGRPTYSGPILDGRLVIETFQAAYEAGKQPDVPLMIGSNSAEVPSGFVNAASKAELLSKFKGLEDKAAAAYDPEGTKDFAEILTRVNADTVWAEPVRFTARAFSDKGSPVFVYLFSYVSPSLKKMMPFGAMHASEIGYVFENLNFWNGAEVTEQDKKVAQMMNAYWVNFARTGNPNGAGLPKWPAFHTQSDEIIEFRADGSARGSADFRKDRLDVIEQMAHFTDREFLLAH